MRISRRDFLLASGGAASLVLLKSPASALAEEAKAQEEVAMLIDVTKCVSCWWCCAACRICNGLPEIFKPDLEEAPPLSCCAYTTLVPVKKDDKWNTRKSACNHCTNAACVEVCPTGALTYNDLGFVQYDPAKCSGCGYCSEYCPFGVPQMESNVLTGAAVMHKCTFCKDRVINGEIPACAAACPTGAIKFGKRSELLKEGKERVVTLKQKNTSATFYGENELGGLHVMYVLDDTPETYSLPAEPKVPAPVAVRNAFKWLGVGAGIAVLLGFGLNYLVAREAKRTSELPGK